MNGHDVRALHQKLRECQRRLGTPAEQVDDFHQVLELAHAINNGMTAEYLRAAEGEDTAISLFAFAQRHLFGSASSAKDPTPKSTGS